MSITSILAGKTAKLITRNKRREEIEIKKLHIGIEIFLNNINKVICIIILSSLFNILPEMIIILTSFSILRRFSFGIHANSSLLCTAITFILFLFGVLISKSVFINSGSVFLCYSIILLIIYKYAPGDTVKLPIPDQNMRKGLRDKSIAVCVICLLVTNVIGDQVIKQLILMGLTLEAVSIMPITYKLMKRR